MLFVVAALAAACWLVPIALRMIVELIATMIAIVLAVRTRRVVRDILAMRDMYAGPELDFDRKPSRAERRALAAGLRLAIRQTELMSLLPHTAARAQRMVAGWHG